MIRCGIRCWLLRCLVIRRWLRWLRWLAGLQGRHEDFLRSLEVICRPVHRLKKKNELDYMLKAVITDQPTNFRLLCPEGSVATGYRGRSGLFIDQVGMKCEVPP